MTERIDGEVEDTDPEGSRIQFVEDSSMGIVAGSLVTYFVGVEGALLIGAIGIVSVWGARYV